jgi:N-acyl amino acid synthase of PEP-CTERM/exosortase system
MFTLGNFAFTRAESEDLRNETYRLRYNIYVEEFGFEKPEDHPGGLETDDYEDASIHFAALYHDKVIGTIRLILDSEKGFPIEHAVQTTFVGQKPPSSKIGEVSRLAVSREFRRRREDGQYGIESYLKKSQGGNLPDNNSLIPAQSQRRHPFIVLGLFLLVYQECKRRDISHVYMITEKKVYHSLDAYGILFYQIGNPVYYHGLRVPYLGIIPHIEQRLAGEKPEILKILTMGLEERYQPKL